MAYTDGQLRRIDALVEQHIMGHDVEWHWCTDDDDTIGGWREADSVHADYKVPANSSGWRFWPCYATDSAPHIEFSVVDNYTTDHNAVAEMRGRLREMGKHIAFGIAIAHEVAAVFELESGSGASDQFVYADEMFGIISASPLEQCLAALQVVGIDVEKELRNEL